MKSLVMIVDTDGQDHLYLILSNDIVIETLVQFPRCRHGGKVPGMLLWLLTRIAVSAGTPTPTRGGPRRRISAAMVVAQGWSAIHHSRWMLLWWLVGRRRRRRMFGGRRRVVEVLHENGRIVLVVVGRTATCTTVRGTKVSPAMGTIKGIGLPFGTLKGDGLSTFGTQRWRTTATTIHLFGMVARGGRRRKASCRVSSRRIDSRVSATGGSLVVPCNCSFLVLVVVVLVVLVVVVGIESVYCSRRQPKRLPHPSRWLLMMMICPPAARGGDSWLGPPSQECKKCHAMNEDRMKDWNGPGQTNANRERERAKSISGGSSFSSSSSSQLRLLCCDCLCVLQKEKEEDTHKRDHRKDLS